MPNEDGAFTDAISRRADVRMISEESQVVVCSLRSTASAARKSQTAVRIR